jgi:hypothetical protein
MRSTRLAIAALALLSASPAVAQDHTWTGDRPDGVAPVSVLGDRTLAKNTFEVRYFFARHKFEGLQFGSQQVAPIEALEFYASVPLQGTRIAHQVAVAYGVTDRIGVLASASWLDRSRDVANEAFFVTTEADGLSDAYVEVQGEFYRSAGVRAHFSAGVDLPVGSIDEEDDLLDLTGQVLPYAMQPGAGTWGLVPGVTAQMQNERGSVGGQVKARIRTGTNDRGYQLGDEVDAIFWAAYRLNRFFSVSSGVQVHNFGPVEGVDPLQDPLRDPGEDPVFSGGRRVDVPLGLNFMAAEGPLEGHRFNVEFLWPVHQDYENFRLRADWGVRIGWQKTF